MTGDLQRRIATVLVRSQHGTLPASKIAELVDLGVGMATAALIVEELTSYVETATIATIDQPVTRGEFERLVEEPRIERLANVAPLADEPEPDPTSTTRVVTSRSD